MVICLIPTVSGSVLVHNHEAHMQLICPTTLQHYPVQRPSMLTAHKSVSTAGRDLHGRRRVHICEVVWSAHQHQEPRATGRLHPLCRTALVNHSHGALVQGKVDPQHIPTPSTTCCASFATLALALQHQLNKPLQL